MTSVGRNKDILNVYLTRLNEIRDTLEISPFFKTHEISVVKTQWQSAVNPDDVRGTQHHVSSDRLKETKGAEEATVNEVGRTAVPWQM
ncbi:inositol-trisphosphate 3-kinase B [Lates japonicus]|uniref:Inositol-trisphosphate 3-kinase B n=1 Tax=Lates japonicus TaxID=270547 RepID=A0AAD3NM62_LATJO|nr:inositol-trisphosphate 3-kinase B [Lates japonicus]